MEGGEVAAELVVDGLPGCSGFDLSAGASEGFFFEPALFGVASFFAIPVFAGGAVNDAEDDFGLEFCGDRFFDGALVLGESEVSGKTGFIVGEAEDEDAFFQRDGDASV